MIEINNLKIKYLQTEHNQVEKLNLKIKQGRCILFAGRSGCGKTTIIRTLNKLIPNFFTAEIEGSIKINGIDIKTYEMYELSKIIGSVFQEPSSQFFNLDVLSELVFSMENLGYERKIIKERLDNTIKQFNLSHLVDKNFFQLSGGERQLIAFACCYLINPDIYLLDEPSANLDCFATERLKKTILSLKEQGKTILIAEHKLSYLKNIVDEIYYIENNKIKKRFSNKEFLELSNQKREALGLRNISTANLNIENLSISSTEKVFECKDLAIGYRKKTLFSNINFKIFQNDIIAIIGKNGIGKTTFIKTLIGLKKQKNGIICLNKKTSKKERLKQSFIIEQNPSSELFAASVKEECSLGFNKPNKDDIEKVLKDLNLDTKKDKHPNTLSGGEKQRLAIALSILNEKSFIFFDEPTSGLDWDNLICVSKIIKNLSKEGKTIFLVTHDKELIFKTCNKIITLKDNNGFDYFNLTEQTRKKLDKFFEEEIK